MKKIYSRLKRLTPLAMGLVLSSGGLKAQLMTQTLSFTGNMQTFQVPACVPMVTVTCYGAEGVSVGFFGYATGKGGMASGVMYTTPGQILNIFVGGQNGYNGGGTGQAGGNGGGASDVRINGTALSNRVIVAGGGGGAGGDNWNCNVGNGHGGGGLAVGTNFVGGGGGAGYTPGTGCGTDGGLQGGIGAQAPSNHGGGGGGGGFLSGGGGAVSQPGTSSPGVLGIGGNAFISPNGCNSEGSGGGGGGYYGGGAAVGWNCGAGRGGGGSSWTGNLTQPAFSPGVRLGNGMVVLSYIITGSNPSAISVSSPNSLDICPGNQVTLNATNGVSYTWTPNSSNQANVTVSPNTTTTYYVVGANASGCVSSAVITVSVNPAPTVSLATTNTFACLGQTTTLTIGGAPTYTWTGPNGPIGNGTMVTVSPSVTTTYTGSGAGANGCAMSLQQQIVVNTITMSVFPSTSVVCTGQSAMFSASGANNFVWTNPVWAGGVPYSYITPTVAGVYTVTGTDANGCVISNTVSLVTNPLPSVTASASKTLICKGESVTLTGGGTATSFAWSGGLGSGASVNVTPPLNTVYVYSVTGTDANGCVGSGMVTVSVKLCTGINEMTGNSSLVKVYPNPSNGNFVVQSDVNVNLNIVNELGQVVKTVEMNGTTIKEVNISGLADGIYFIKGETAGKTINQKIVVAK